MELVRLIKEALVAIQMKMIILKVIQNTFAGNCNQDNC